MIPLSLLIAAQALNGPTLAEVEALSPEGAGERLLQGRTHEQIVAAGRRDERHIGIPGMTDYELTEAARAVPGGCLRRRWTARFVTAADAAGASPVFSNAIPREEIALASRSGCPDNGYTLINGGLDHDRRVSPCFGASTSWRPGRSRSDSIARAKWSPIFAQARRPSGRPSIQTRLGHDAVIGIRGVLAGRARPAGHRRQVPARPA